MDWSLMPVDPSADQEQFHAWLEDALEIRRARRAVPFTVIDARHETSRSAARATSHSVRSTAASRSAGPGSRARPGRRARTSRRSCCCSSTRSSGSAACASSSRRTPQRALPARAGCAPRAVRGRVPQAHARRQRRHAPARLRLVRDRRRRLAAGESQPREPASIERQRPYLGRWSQSPRRKRARS